MKKIVFKYFPVAIQNTLISLFNTYQYKIRHSGLYREYFSYYSKINLLSPIEVKIEREKRLAQFLAFAREYSQWYCAKSSSSNLLDFPIITKENILNNLNEISTIKEKDGLISFTGGTTGASMKVIYTRRDMQERFAILDAFRASYGYKLGAKTAWFSGKDIVGEKDINKGICYRDDWINKIRFFSTFHINDNNFDIYWHALNRFAPEFLVGFPSSVYEICVMAKSKGLTYIGKVSVFFPTAETVLGIHRDVISEVLGCTVIDQYASSEGAPFILECAHGSKHLHLLTGVFEVVDQNFQPAEEGELLVTSFTTHGTPLIRYRIGDRLKLASSDFKCSCGSFFPVVESIDGRNMDYILSPEHGKVNLGNISNATKDVTGLISFQIIQKTIDRVEVKIVSSLLFDKKQQAIFTQALRLRLGNSMYIDFNLVDNISKEKSGKFRIVKNYLN